MTYADDNELEEQQVFGLKFKATHAEQRALWMKLCTTTQSREWGIARNLLTLVTSHTKTMEIEELATRMENADTAMTKLASKLIEELLSSRSRDS